MEKNEEILSVLNLVQENKLNNKKNIKNDLKLKDKSTFVIVACINHPRSQKFSHQVITQ